MKECSLIQFALMSLVCIFSNLGTPNTYFRMHALWLLNGSDVLLAGDPDSISKVPGREDINHLDGWDKSENLQLLNLTLVLIYFSILYSSCHFYPLTDQ